MPGMAGDVSGSGGLSGRSGSRASRSVIGLAGGGVGGDRRGAHLAHGRLTTRPGATGLDGLPGPVVVRVILEVREHVLRTVSGPERQRPVVRPVESHV